MARTLAPITSLADLMAFANPADDRALARLEMAWKATESEIRRFCGQNIAQPADPYVGFLPAKDLFNPVDPLLSHDNVVPGGFGYSWRSGPQADGHLLPLRQGLVRSITSVYVDTGGSGGTDASDFAVATLLPTTDYFLDIDEKDPNDLVISRSGNLVRKYGTWPTRRRSVKVTYVAGLTGAELDDEFSDLRMAVVEEVLDRWHSYTQIGSAPIKREQLGDWEIEYQTTETDGDAALSSKLRSQLQPWRLYRF